MVITKSQAQSLTTNFYFLTSICMYLLCFVGIMFLFIDLQLNFLVFLIETVREMIVDHVRSVVKRVSDDSPLSLRLVKP